MQGGKLEHGRSTKRVSASQQGWGGERTRCSRFTPAARQRRRACATVGPASTASASSALLALPTAPVACQAWFPRWKIHTVPLPAEATPGTWPTGNGGPGVPPSPPRLLSAGGGGLMAAGGCQTLASRTSRPSAGRPPAPPSCRGNSTRTVLGRLGLCCLFGALFTACRQRRCRSWETANTPRGPSPPATAARRGTT